MRTSEMHFDDIDVVYIDTRDGDGPMIPRSEYEQLRELKRSLQNHGEQHGVMLSMTMFERVLQAIASGLLHQGRD
jgi:hypothetical protein